MPTSAPATRAVGDGANGRAPRVTFMGVACNARTVAFVCEGSGSMMNKLDPMRVELGKAIDGLQPTQSFAVLFFDALTDFDGSLTPATVDHKCNAIVELDRVIPRGAMSPIPTIEQAFRSGAEVIYLLEDGDFSNNREVAATIAALNRDKHVRVNMILFGNKQEIAEASDFQKVFKQVAADNGGVFAAVDVDLLVDDPTKK